MVKFVQATFNLATFVIISNISAVTEPILNQTFSTQNFFAPNFFWTQIFSNLELFYGKTRMKLHFCEAIEIEIWKCQGSVEKAPRRSRRYWRIDIYASEILNKLQRYSDQFSWKKMPLISWHMPEIILSLAWDELEICFLYAFNLHSKYISHAWHVPVLWLFITKLLSKHIYSCHNLSRVEPGLICKVDTGTA